MLKKQELGEGCMSTALDDEMTFVLLARDAAAPKVIHDWIKRRLKMGKNKTDDPQIVEAFRCAAYMDKQRDEIRERLRDSIAGLGKGK